MEYPVDIKSVSQSKQPHKFFERFLDNDLSILAKELANRYEKIERAEVLGVSEVKENELSTPQTKDLYENFDSNNNNNNRFNCVSIINIFVD